ncbi:cobyric acid synthase [Prolixibacter bellariivorans]|nr:cobyric acid synthase [Prolixibacter bellariivorans]
MEKKLKPLMFVGTGSDVGKSIITAGFCRILKQDGYRPAPFKAQNMSLNSYATPEGLEIGRAQAVQAEAAGIACRSEMNPVLLKPTGDQHSQVVLNGRPIGNQSAKTYFLETDRDYLFNQAMKAWHYLNGKYHPMVMEGAGSISELNLRDKDITNMRIARETGAATFLVADIDRGGVFASVYGSVMLLPPEERDLIAGIIINKFRGDMSLFDEGRKIMEEITGKPVVGVIPYFHNIRIEDEDAVPLALKRHHPVQGKINVAVVLFPRMANFTDFSLLEQISRVNLYFTHDISAIREADMVILPGSKNTIDDLLYLKSTGMADELVKAAQNGKPLYGICGGYQMMGTEIHDPDGVEGKVRSVKGLEILPVTTTLTGEKITRQRRFAYREGKALTNSGYEIHMGETVLSGGKPVAWFEDGTHDGCLLNEHCWGSYLHGIFDNREVVEQILKTVSPGFSEPIPDYLAFKEEQYDKLATHIREHVDMDQFYRLITHENQGQ